MLKTPLITLALRICIAIIVASCSSTISPFSQQAYKYATELKVDTLKLLERAETPYLENRKQIEKLTLELEKAFEFAKGRPHNEHSTAQWAILLDPERNLLGGFLNRWQREKSLSYPFIRESQRLIAEAFDTIIGLESGKIRYDD